MAKQTFTTGQVLTAAQMTSLQQTAMLGGSTTVKTASYTLVAADAGTTVAMSAAGATTITVNTSLFSSGDIVFIQNRGAGACTVTAGTATVATAGSLILPQNDAGILYFTATGASIFYDFIQAGAVSPLTTKGDLYTFSTSDARLAVGTNTHVLTADSAEATGLKWAAPAGGGMTLLNSGGTALSGAATTVSFTSTGYTNLQIQIKGASLAANANGYHLRLNGDTAGNYASMRYMNYNTGGSVLNSNSSGDTEIIISNRLGNVSTYYQTGNATINVYRPTDTDFQFITWDSGGYNSTLSDPWYVKGNGYYDCAAAISSVTITPDSSTFNAGTIYVYGVK